MEIVFDTMTLSDELLSLNRLFTFRLEKKKANSYWTQRYISIKENEKIFII